MPENLFEKSLRLEILKKSESTVVANERPGRIIKTLEQINKVYGENQIIFVGYKMTKENEVTYRGPGMKVLKEIRDYLNENNTTDGAYTVVIAPFVSRVQSDVYDVSLDHLIDVFHSKIDITPKNLAILIEQTTGLSKMRIQKKLEKLI